MSDPTSSVTLSSRSRPAPLEPTSVRLARQARVRQFHNFWSELSRAIPTHINQLAVVPNAWAVGDRCHTGVTLRSFRPIAVATRLPRQRRFRPPWMSSGANWVLIGSNWANSSSWALTRSWSACARGAGRSVVCASASRSGCELASSLSTPKPRRKCAGPAGHAVDRVLSFGQLGLGAPRPPAASHVSE